MRWIISQPVSHLVGVAHHEAYAMPNGALEASNISSKQDDEGRSGLLWLAELNTDLKGKSAQQMAEMQQLALRGLDTGKEAAHELGLVFQSLEILRLSQSTIHSFRDLGCELDNLLVLSASCCGVTDLDGITSLPVLEELYLPFNDVQDCTALAFHDTLHVLDLESNRIADEAELATLGTCPKLTCLTLLGNPIASTLHYGRLVSHHIAHLEVLDDQPRDAANQQQSVDDSIFAQENRLLGDSIKHFRPRSANFPVTSLAGELVGSRRPVSAPLASDHPCWAEMLVIRHGGGAPSTSGAGSASALTHGAGGHQLSGSIAKGIRRHRRNIKPAPRPGTMLAQQPELPSSLMLDRNLPISSCSDSVLSEYVAVSAVPEQKPDEVNTTLRTSPQERNSCPMLSSTAICQRFDANVRRAVSPSDKHLAKCNRTTICF